MHIYIYIHICVCIDRHDPRTSTSSDTEGSSGGASRAAPEIAPAPEIEPLPEIEAGAPPKTEPPPPEIERSPPKIERSSPKAELTPEIDPTGIERPPSAILGRRRDGARQRPRRYRRGERRYRMGVVRGCGGGCKLQRWSKKEV